MAFEGEERIVARHAVTVVLDPHERAPAVAELDLDPRGPSVEGVFQQLLHHCSRALNHLTSGDLVGDSVGENTDFGHARNGGQALRLLGQRHTSRAPAVRAPVRILGLARHLMVWTFLPEAALRGRDGSGVEGRLKFAWAYPSIPFSSVHLRKPTREGACSTSYVIGGKSGGIERFVVARLVSGGTGRVRREAGPCSHEQGHYSANATPQTRVT